MQQLSLIHIFIVTVDSLGDKTAQEFADDYYDSGGYGMGEDVYKRQDEQNRVSDWVKKHKAELAAAGSSEKWHCACCVAVPSEDPMGYDYIAVKEVQS